MLNDFIMLLSVSEGLILDNSEQADNESLKLLINLTKQHKKI